MGLDFGFQNQEILESNMCGRFTLTVDPSELQENFGEYKMPLQFAPRFNIAPTQPVLAIPNDGRNTADFFV